MTVLESRFTRHMVRIRAHAWLAVLVVAVIRLSVGVLVEKGRKGHYQTNMCLKLKKIHTRRQPSDGTRKYSKAKEMSVVFSIPLQSTKDITTTIDIGRHKQRAMYAYTY